VKGNLEVDLSAYTITWTEDAGPGHVGTVLELPGCIAFAADEVRRDAAVRQAIVLYCDEHPDVPRRYRASRHDRG
jgi:hypothetical protein